MDIVFGILGQVIVEDMGDCFNMKTTGGDIGGDQDVEFLVFEAFQGGHPFLLRNIAGQAGCPKTIGLKVVFKNLGHSFGVGENQTAFGFFPVQNAKKQSHLFVFADMVKALFDFINRNLFRIDIGCFTDIKMFISEFHDFL